MTRCCQCSDVAVKADLCPPCTSTAQAEYETGGWAYFNAVNHSHRSVYFDDGTVCYPQSRVCVREGSFFSFDDGSDPTGNQISFYEAVDRE